VTDGDKRSSLQQFKINKTFLILPTTGSLFKKLGDQTQTGDLQKEGNFPRPPSPLGKISDSNFYFSYFRGSRLGRGTDKREGQEENHGRSVGVHARWRNGEPSDEKK